MKLADRVAVVTGAGSGIGRAIACAFAREGATVIVNDLAVARSRETVDAMGAAGVRARAVEADVAESRAVRAMFAEVEREFGRVDVLVNNAGIGSSGGPASEETAKRHEARIGELMAGGAIKTHWDVTERMTDETWHRMIAVHLNGTFFCTREALRLMKPGGAIVNLSSVAALTGLETVPHYSAAKGGILSFTRAVAREVASRGIRVNAICPGYVDTPMTQPMSALMKRLTVSRTPLHRMGVPDDIARTALFLASDDGSFFTGQWLSPNGGLVMQ
ncbi:MAG: 3-oxoacyl-ACP reductase FabG [Candidatus Rokubacteria bacterium]|nr:3-oxoacyl-ACP reductase FabG [Candidatus Rokubacteria bacterium]